MAGVFLRSAVHSMRTALDPTARTASDEQLLQRFVSHRDEVAFTTLVQRYRNLVYAVCRRVSQQDQDAEDAFQATFFVLARQASSIHNRQSLGSWLHGVAFRTALSARKCTMRRQKYEQNTKERQTESPVAESALRELQSLLDEEVNRLPERLKSPFVLCCLEGKSREEAARDLGWKEGTVSSRLALARERLRQRLSRRGISITAVLSAVALATPSRSLASSLLATMERNAMEYTADTVTHTLPQHVVSLANGVIISMSKSTLKLVSIIVVVVGLIGSGIGGIAIQSSLANQQDATPSPAKPSHFITEPIRKKNHPSVEVILDQAAKAIRETNTFPLRRWVLVKIAVEQEKIGNKKAAKQSFAEAIESASKLSVTVDDPYQKVFVLSLLADAQFQSGDVVAARKTYDEAYSITQKNIVSDDIRSDNLQLIARLQAVNGEIKQARKVAADVKPEFYRDQVLADIALAQAKGGDVKGAVIEANKLLHPINRLIFWLGLAEWQTDQKDKEALTSLQKARDESTKVGDHDLRSVLMINLAILEARNGDDDSARKTFEKVKNANRGQFLLRLATVQALRGDRDKAKKTLEEVNEVKDTNLLLQYYLATLNAMGDYKLAFETAKEIKDKLQRAEQLEHLAQSQAKAGYAEDAYVWAVKETDPLAKARALYGVAMGLSLREKMK